MATGLCRIVFLGRYIKILNCVHYDLRSWITNSTTASATTTTSTTSIAIALTLAVVPRAKVSTAACSACTTTPTRSGCAWAPTPTPTSTGWTSSRSGPRGRRWRRTRSGWRRSSHSCQVELGGGGGGQACRVGRSFQGCQVVKEKLAWPNHP